ncbi:partner and localizer of BRCA2 [Syngnathus scovelli]|uniref:partner and localizer of BRCA2 n=1 Tax=Syngnathus scovelli TaxID=161590 RepID=UPI0021109CC7|nr:partner and localizer of BRCA2 [Syngnathus scovelli]
MQSGTLHCEEQLRSTLYCDDKDNLKRKLDQLQQEYLKIAQKLQRAEQLEAVRKHRNDVPKRRCQDQPGPDGASKSTDGASPAHSSYSGMDRTLVASTPRLKANRSDPVSTSRASPTLRLRSRRSRLRWQRRSQEAGTSQDEARFVDESQSLDSPSPSLLLSHWSLPSRQDDKQNGEREADVPDDLNGTDNRSGGDGGHLTLEEKTLVNSPRFCSGETRGGGKGERLLESCTLVEGLPFPVEYYVRTTRRMALSQSQPDLRAVIHTQLSSGRPRRKRAGPLNSGAVEPVTHPRVAGSRRGRKSRRGRGRGRPLLSTGLCLHEADSSHSHQRLEEIEPAPDEGQMAFPPSAPQKPVTPLASSSESWRSLLLPTPKLTPTPPLPPLTQLVGHLPHFDLHRDFYLPDEHFASLKLDKLRRVAAESGIEAFAMPRRNATPATALGAPLDLKSATAKSSDLSDDNDPKNTDMRLPHPDPDDTCLSPAEREPKGSDRHRDAILSWDGPLVLDQEDNRHQEVFFPKAVQNSHSIQSGLQLSPPEASAPLHPMSPALPSSPEPPSLGLTPLAASPVAAVTPSLSPCSPLHRSPAFSPPIVCSQPPALDAQMAVEDHGSCTLKAPAGGALVDACCLSDSDGRLCVVAAGKWAASWWSRAPSRSWARRHVWSFTEPLLNVFPVPGGAALVCVTLGELEIKEVRVLSCGSGEPAALLSGDVQAAAGVAESRVVTSSLSDIGCTLQAFTLASDGSTSHCVHLATPDICVRALAPVDVLPDALIGTDERGRLFVWNLKNGHLLQKIQLDASLSHTTCLRGFSCRGVLLVLLQHLFPDWPHARQNITNDETFHKQREKKKPALFSMLAVNPLSGKSILAAPLETPASWSGRLCEADASDVAAVGINQSGCVCVWSLRRRHEGITVTAAPDGEGWQLARWADDGATLVTGHSNGDVTLHFDLAT